MVEGGIKKNKYFYVTMVSVITALVALLLFFVVIRPFFGKAQELTKETKAKQEQLTKLKDKLAKLEELKSREEQLKKDAETVKNALPESKDAGRLFIEFDNIAKSSSGTIKSVTEATAGGVVAAQAPTAAAATTNAFPGIQKVSYAAPIDFPSYFNFKDFITKAETALRLVSVDDFMITVNPNNTMTVNFNTSTYTRGQ